VGGGLVPHQSFWFRSNISVQINPLPIFCYRAKSPLIYSYQELFYFSCKLCSCWLLRCKKKDAYIFNKAMFFKFWQHFGIVKLRRYDNKWFREKIESSIVETASVRVWRQEALSLCGPNLKYVWWVCSRAESQIKFIRLILL